WDFDALPSEIKVDINHMPVSAFPAIVDTGNTVAIRSFDTKEKAQLQMKAGLKRLFMLELEKDFNYLGKNLPRITEMNMYYSATGKAEDLKNEIINLVAEDVFMTDNPDIRNHQAFDERKAQGRAQLISVANDICELVLKIL